MTQPETGPAMWSDPQGGEIAARLNWLRAGVMGANDGIVSTAGLVVGVAGAAVSDGALLAAGVSAMVAGALSMGVGEYVSVSSQRDSERAELDLEQHQLLTYPEEEIAQLTRLIGAQGLEPELAHTVAAQLTERDALAAHARYGLGLDPDQLTNPWHAAWASMAAFVVGALVPLLAIVFSPRDLAVPLTAVAVVIALAATGSLSARLGHAPRLPAMARTIGGGVLAMTVTYGIGLILGAAT